MRKKFVKKERAIQVIPRIFAVRISEPIDSETFKFLLTFVGEQKRERIARRSDNFGRDLSLSGEILVLHALCEVFGLDRAEIEIEIGKNGKPNVVGEKNIHFNISHSGEYAVCAVCDTPVGVDIEKIREVDFRRIAKRYFRENEAEKIADIDDFFSLWTKKESYLKMTGDGISGGLDTPFENSKFVEIDDIDGYKICLCYVTKLLNH